MTGLREGFRIGFQGNGRCCLAKANMRLATERAEVLSGCLQEECASGRVLGPFRKKLLGTALMINRFGVIPKGSTGKWHLIVDLSFPEGNSVNGGIDPQHFFTPLHESGGHGKGVIQARTRFVYGESGYLQCLSDSPS